MKGESARGILGWPKGGYIPNPGMGIRFDCLTVPSRGDHDTASSATVTIASHPVMREMLPSRLTT
jgi:hypothetical protein